MKQIRSVFGDTPNLIAEAILMCTYIYVYFYGEIMKIIPKLSSNTINCFHGARHKWINNRKKTEYSDTRKICCTYSQSRTVWFYERVMRLKDADGMANGVDPDLRLSEQSDLGLHCLPRPARPKT